MTTKAIHKNFKCAKLMRYNCNGIRYIINGNICKGAIEREPLFKFSIMYFY